jgi:hypothetical protein
MRGRPASRFGSLVGLPSSARIAGFPGAAADLRSYGPRGSAKSRSGGYLAQDFDDWSGGNEDWGLEWRLVNRQ